MKEVKFRISSGSNILVECTDINIAMAACRGIIAEFGNGDEFIITLTKETIEINEQKTEEVKEDTKVKR